MKRAMYRNATIAAATGLMLAAGLGLGLAACTPAQDGGARKAQGGSSPSAWNQTPVIEAAQVDGREVRLSGSAQPGARIVLRSAAGAAYAAVAGDDGRFDLRMEAPAQDLWLKPETQVGQDAAASPDTLFVPAGGQGPIAVLRAGGPTRRLDRAPALGAIDSDGQARRLAGRTAQGTQTLPVTVGEVSLQAFPDAAGHWNIVLGPEASGDQIVIGDEVFVWPGRGEAGGQTPRRERAAEGWRVVWAEGGALQTAWLPDAR
ncbi:hypothetical protein [uncultured Brevundimonas sp.]|uniref:hypothetical protein n=1 Tax=uncultured Brevundimonas sp. TaxID=213418 RepID=UPI0025F08A5A|nr:hypothetical protein [uncultured Brevundimonas sp.]